MVDYGKLIDEERNRRDSALAGAEARKEREIELVAFFRSVEIALGEEMAKANEVLRRRGAPTIAGPFRPVKTEEQIEVTFGTRTAACQLRLESVAKESGPSRLAVDLLDSTGQIRDRIHYLLEGEGADVKAYKPLVEDFPDPGGVSTPEMIAQEIVPGIIRGYFA